MITSCRSTFIAALFAIVIPVLAHAHPGHDDHDFTWDFSHLTAHPWATLGCLAALFAGAWIVWRWLKNAALRSAARRLPL
ncbi:MAG TPA: hypothetical protein VL069_15700 [Opitutus sp.]|nr:hypothetical protein [Opitutus sp.]